MSLQPSFLGLGAEWHRGGVLIGRVLAVGAVLVVAARTGEDPDDQVSWATLERTGPTCFAVVKDGELVRDASWGLGYGDQFVAVAPSDGLTSAVLEGLGAT